MHGYRGFLDKKASAKVIYMNILILEASGEIPRYLVPMLLDQTDAHLVLYARDASCRIAVIADCRCRLRES